MAPCWYHFATSRFLTRTYFLLHFSHFLASQIASKINYLRTPSPQSVWEPLQNTCWVHLGSSWVNFGIPGRYQWHPRRFSVLLRPPMVPKFGQLNPEGAKVTKMTPQSAPKGSKWRLKGIQLGGKSSIKCQIVYPILGSWVQKALSSKGGLPLSCALRNMPFVTRPL